MVADVGARHNNLSHIKRYEINESFSEDAKILSNFTLFPYHCADRASVRERYWSNNKPTITAICFPKSQRG